MSFELGKYVGSVVLNLDDGENLGLYIRRLIYLVYLFFGNDY